MGSSYLLFFLFINLIRTCICIEPITTLTTLTGVSVSAIASYLFYYQRGEYCDKPYIDFKISNFQQSLEKNLIGQHLAKFYILGTLKGYLNNQNPKKALVMSLHGPTGTGKNFISSIIANNLYKNGVKSKFVHQYIANKDFPHEADVSKYQDMLTNDIQKYTKECHRNLFIFDEVDKMPPGTLDALKPFIDYYEIIDGVDYRKNIFIFLSNAGSNGIIEIALNFWKDGKDRESITMKDIEPLISKGSFNERGGFQFSELLSSALIDVYVPFLPLEKSHVRKCIEAEIENQKLHLRDSLVKNVADELQYFPKEVELFSASGCKRIKHKIDAYVYD